MYLHQNALPVNVFVTISINLVLSSALKYLNNIYIECADE